MKGRSGIQTSVSLLLALAMGFAGVFAHAAEKAEKPVAKINEAAPDFKLPDLDGKEHSLSQYKGKIVVLEWFNVDCPFVLKHYNSGNMPALQKAYKEKDVVWLSICSSAPGKQGHFAPDKLKERTDKMGFQPTAILQDAKGDTGRAYDAKTTPHMYIVDKEGVLVYNGGIDSIRSAKVEDIEKAVPHVKNALDALLACKKPDPATTTPYGCSVKY
jgi:peroxiredoxin